MDEEQHASILMACKAIVENFQEPPTDPNFAGEKTDRLEGQIRTYLGKGTPSISIAEAFKIALEVECSELDAIYSELLKPCGPEVAKTMEHVGVPASVQRRKLASAVHRFTSDPNYGRQLRIFSDPPCAKNRRDSHKMRNRSPQSGYVAS